MCSVPKLIEVFRTTTCVITTGPSETGGSEPLPPPNILADTFKPYSKLGASDYAHRITCRPWIFITLFSPVLTKLAEPIQVTVG